MTTLNINKLSPLQPTVWKSYLIPQTKVEEEKYCELDQAIYLTVYINIVAIPTLNIDKLSPLQLLISYRLEIIELWVSN